jgi:diguanylate cyclase (GGDEF)-like protein
MAYSRKLGPPIVSAAVATLVLTNFTTVVVVKRDAASGTELFDAIWPILLTSAVAIVLVMSFLYRSLVDLVQELERREASAQHQAVHDPLTGLANRALLEDRLDQAIGRYRRNNDMFALLILDLDRFKLVNDTFGHAAGDLLVQQVAERLAGLIRETDTIARIGGDEFAIVQSSIKSEADIRRLCGRIIESIDEPFYLGGREARVGVSVGAVLVDGMTSEASDLIRKADITMYRAKSASRNCYRLFSEEMDVAVQRRNLVETKLRHALEAGTGIELHYQPQLDTQGAVVAVEALLRWTDEELGEIPPIEVIPIAEESGLITALGEVTFRMACRSAAEWPHLLVAVNFSPLQFREEDLPSRLRAIALEEGVECDRIEIEITESLLIEHADVSEAAIRELREIGFRIALDDFGTGYSSLSYLRRFPVDKIKLDRSFIESVDMDQSISIIRAAVTLGHALNLTVVAEGISSPEQERIALEAGCDGLQGHRYAAAMPAEAIKNFKPLCPDLARVKAA